ncbi:MAG: outer membrane beta-barrel protein [Candidatus Aureabacteria bacterium]|nr:outer membrane beta-barrel protein [Candidatus Auribacterota bacterium]
MKSTLRFLAPLLLLACALPAAAGEFRMGAHAILINPRDSDFKDEFGYGALMKYKFTDTLGIEIGGDYFRWETDELTTMPFGGAPGPVTYHEVDRVYPLYLTTLICAPFMEQSARAYLGLGGGYYQVSADIDGSYYVNNYLFTISGKVDGQWAVHAGAGADFELSEHIFLNVEARYVFVDLNREMTHSNPVMGSVTVKDEVEFNNWQIRAGLEYSF